jgi:hypothetical protein
MYLVQTLILIWFSNFSYDKKIQNAKEKQAIEANVLILLPGDFLYE